MADEVILEGDEFASSFGESLDKTLDIDTWSSHDDLLHLYQQMEREVQEAVQQGDSVRDQLRGVVFPKLSSSSSAIAETGVYRATVENIQQVHNQLLFNGNVEACDGNSLVDDRLPLTITQIGVALVSYHGERGTWAHRLFRRDLRQHNNDVVAEMLDLLEKRSQRNAIDVEERQDQISALARRGVMAYAERAILLNRSDKPWRMGHGNPAPYEILTGSGSMDLLEKGIEVLYKLLGEHKRFVYVPSTTSLRGRLYPTLGDALNPLEYIVLESAQSQMLKIIDSGHYATKYRNKAAEFANTVGPDILIGIYRTNRLAPARVFFGHREYIHQAALIAMADSVLVEHRGFPTLIDLADTVCRNLMGADSFVPSVDTAYLSAGAPFSHTPERANRPN